MEEASSPETTPERLREICIGASPEVCRALARNANTPKDLLLQLCEKAPRAFIENPSLPLLLLEDPTFLFKLSEKACQQVLQEQPGGPPLKYPDWLWSALSQHPKGDVRSLVARSQSAPPFILERLVSDYASKKALSYNLKAPRSVLEALAVDPDHGLRYNVSSLSYPHEHKPRELIALLCRVGCQESLITRSAPDLTLTADELVAVAARGYFAWVLVAAHPNTPLSLLAELSDKVERGIFNDRSRGDWEEIRWIGQAGWEFFAALAKNSQATPELLANAERVCKRHSHPSINEVRANVARHPNTPLPILERLAVIPDVPGYPTTTIRQGVAENPGTPAQLLVTLSQERISSILLAVIKHPNTPIEVLTRLSLLEGMYQAEVRRAASDALSTQGRKKKRA